MIEEKLMSNVNEKIKSIVEEYDNEIELYIQFVQDALQEIEER